MQHTTESAGIAPHRSTEIATPIIGSNGYPAVVSVIPVGGILSEKHRRELEIDSAIASTEIEAHGLFSLPSGHASCVWLKEQGFTDSQASTGASGCLVIPRYDYRGQVFGYQIKPDHPRMDGRKNKPIKYEVPKGSEVRLDAHPADFELLKDPRIPLAFTEGIKKLLSAKSHGLLCLSVNGVHSFLGKNSKGGHTTLSEFDEIAWKGDSQNGPLSRLCLLIFDSDITDKDAVHNALVRLGGILTSRGATVKMVTLPAGIDGAKVGLDDFFVQGGTVEQLMAMATNLIGYAERQRQKAEDKKKERLAKLATRSQSLDVPQIEVSDRQLPDLTADLAKAVARLNYKSPQIFNGPTGLTVVHPDKDNVHVLKSITLESMQDLAGDAATWVSTDERGNGRNVFPPKAVCSVFIQTPNKWENIGPIEKITGAPFYDSEGKLCDRDGYHKNAQAWLQLSKGFTLGDTSPTPHNVAAARHLIEQTILGEVAFFDDASRAHAIALMLQPLIRRIVNGGTPLYLYDAPTQSSGKSYAASLSVYPHGPFSSFDDIQNKEEWEKAIFTAFLEGRSHLFFDNITGRLNSPTLASYMTEPRKSARLLGFNKTVTVNTFSANWVATSNNAILSADAISRIVKVRIDTKMETPESRVYKSDPMAYIKENRGSVFTALLTLVNSWIDEGKPEFTAKKHRFAEWSRVMGGILEVAGIPGFLDNLEAERDNMSPERDAWREFVTIWFERHGENSVTAKELLEIALQCDGMKAQLGDADNQAKRLGDFLSRRRDQIFADFQIQRAAEKDRYGVKWRLLNRNPEYKNPQSPTPTFALSSPEEAGVDF